MNNYLKINNFINSEKMKFKNNKKFNNKKKKVKIILFLFMMNKLNLISNSNKMIKTINY